MKKILIPILILFLSSMTNAQESNCNDGDVQIAMKYRLHELEGINLYLKYPTGLETDAILNRLLSDHPLFTSRQNIYNLEKRQEDYEIILMDLATMASYGPEKIRAIQKEYLDNVPAIFRETVFYKWMVDYIDQKIDLDKTLSDIETEYVLNTKGMDIVTSLYNISKMELSRLDNIEKLDDAELYYVKDVLFKDQSYDLTSKALGNMMKAIEPLAMLGKVAGGIDAINGFSNAAKDIMLNSLVTSILSNQIAIERFEIIKNSLLGNDNINNDPALLAALVLVGQFLNETDEEQLAQAKIDEIKSHAGEIIGNITTIAQTFGGPSMIKILQTVSKVNLAPTPLIMWTIGIHALKYEIGLIQEFKEQYDDGELSILSSSIGHWLCEDVDEDCRLNLMANFAYYKSFYFLKEVVDKKPLFETEEYWNSVLEEADHLKDLTFNNFEYHYKNQCDIVSPQIEGIVSKNAIIQLTFSEAIQQASLISALDIKNSSGNSIEFTLNLDPEMRIAFINSQELIVGNPYRLVISEELKDLSQNIFDGDYDGNPGGEFEINITIHGLNAKFTSNVQNGSVPIEVSFKDESDVSGTDISNWSWDFGDGSSSSEKNPQHTYTHIGNFDVQLTISDGSESVSIKREAYIAANDARDGHDLEIKNLKFGEPYIPPGSTFDFNFDIRNPGIFAEDNYLIRYGIYNSLGQLINEKSISGTSINPSPNDILAVFNEDLSIPAGTAKGFYQFKIQIDFSSDYILGNNVLEQAVYIGTSNPYSTYKRSLNSTIYNKGVAYTIAGYSVRYTASDNNSARVIVNGEQKDIKPFQLAFFDSYKFLMIFEGSLSGTEAIFSYALPTSEVSFSPAKIVCEAGMKATYAISSNEEDPTPTLNLFNQEATDYNIVNGWSKKTYVKGVPYSNAYFDLTPPLDADRENYAYWVEFVANDKFLQKLEIEVIDPKPDFSFSLDKSHLTTGPGMIGKYIISIDTDDDFSEDIYPDIIGLPQGITASFSSNSIKNDGQFEVRLEIENNFIDYGNYPLKLILQSNSRVKEESIFITVVDISSHYCAIDSLAYIDLDNCMDSLEVFFKAEFSSGSTAITSDWQYQSEDGAWHDILPVNILNNNAFNPGNSSIIWRVNKSSSLYINDARFRMKTRSGPDFMTQIATADYSGEDFYGATMIGNVMHTIEDVTGEIYKFTYTDQVNYLGKININLPASTGQGMAQCYNRIYIYDTFDELIYSYTSNWGYLGVKNISVEWFSLFEMNEKLYIQDKDIKKFVELDVNLNPTGNYIDCPYIPYTDFAFYDGLNVWMGDGNMLVKISPDFQSYVTSTLPRDLNGVCLYDDKLYAVDGNDDVFIYNFVDPFSLYAESASFQINNRYRPIIKGLEAATVSEDEVLSMEFMSKILDQDTPVDQLEINVNSNDAGALEAFLDPNDQQIKIIPNADWWGLSSISISIKDAFAESIYKLDVQVEPVNDAPILIDSIFNLYEDEIGIFNLQKYILDIDDPLENHTVSFNLPTEVGNKLSITKDGGQLSISGVPDYFNDSISGIITVSDGSGGLVTAQALIRVKSENDLPTAFAKVSPPDDSYITSDNLVFSWEKSTDKETDSLSYILLINSSVLDTVISIDTNTISIHQQIISELNEMEVIEWIVLASDGIALVYANNNYGHFTLANDSAQFHNFPPEYVGSIDVVILDEDFKSFNFTDDIENLFTDRNNDLLTYSVSTTSTLFNVDIDAGTISLTSNENAYGEDTFIIETTDGVNSNQQIITVLIESVNDSPSFDSTPIDNVKYGEHYIYEIKVSDVDGENITISCSDLPSWLSFEDQLDGIAIIEGSPEVNQSASINIKIEATDHVVNNPVIQEYQLVVDASNFIDSKIVKHIQCYPNPTSKYVIIKTINPNIIIENIEIIDLKGKIVANDLFDQYIAANGKINVEQLNPGIYIIRIRMNVGYEDIKLIKNMSAGKH